MARGKTAKQAAAPEGRDGEDRAPSRVHAATKALRAQALRAPEGALIGSEDELLARYQVSRPTLRQAAACVVQEQLIEVRRGVGGGYFARRPDIRSVTSIASVYFRSKGTTMAELLLAIEPLRTEIARLATRSDNAAARSELAEFLDRQRRVTLELGRDSYTAFLKSLRDFGRITGDLGQNDPLSLFQSILYDVCAHVRRDEDLYFGRLDRMNAYHELMLRQAEAILARDEELAVLTSTRSAKLHTQWVKEDMGRGVSVSVDEAMSGAPKAARKRAGG
ncbi:MAG: GntR family transcriptional regulator [Hyphomonadaceae bacterium]|nr:GntR family transcriptional regulator [Hyphomonadaceae bacterium]